MSYNGAKVRKIVESSKVKAGNFIFYVKILRFIFWGCYEGLRVKDEGGSPRTEGGDLTKTAKTPADVISLDRLS